MLFREASKYVQCLLTEHKRTVSNETVILLKVDVPTSQSTKEAPVTSGQQTLFETT